MSKQDSTTAIEQGVTARPSIQELIDGYHKAAEAAKTFPAVQYRAAALDPQSGAYDQGDPKGFDIDGTEF